MNGEQSLVAASLFRRDRARRPTATDQSAKEGAHESGDLGGEWVQVYFVGDN